LVPSSWPIRPIDQTFPCPFISENGFKAVFWQAETLKLAYSCFLKQSLKKDSKTVDKVALTQTKNQPLAAWRSGHRISLRDSGPGFASRQGIRFLGKTQQCCCLILT
jgi:hypothetical protein